MTALPTFYQVSELTPLPPRLPLLAAALQQHEHRRRHFLSAIADAAVIAAVVITACRPFDGGSTPLSSDRGCCRHDLIVSLPSSSSHVGASPDPHNKKMTAPAAADQSPPVRRRCG